MHRTRTALLALALAIALAAAPASAQAPALRIGEQDAVARALAASPRLRAAAAERGAAAADVRAVDATLSPVLLVGADGRHVEALIGAAAGVARTMQDGGSAGTSVRMLTELGTSIELGVRAAVGWRTTNRDPTSTTLFRIGPNYSAEVTLDVRQPLLRGAGDDAVLGPRRQADAAQRAAEQGVAQATSQLVLDVLEAHRELWYAGEALRVAEEALALARRQHEEATLRLEELGSLPRTEVLRYASALAAAEQAHERARADRDVRALALARWLGLDAEEARALEADVVEVAATAPPPLARLVEAASLRSPELLALEADVLAARERERVARDADQPRLDLTGSLAVGVLFDERTIGSLQLPSDRPATSVIVGLELELPLGSSPAQEARRAASSRVEAALARYEDRAQALAADAASRHVEMAAAARRIEVADRAAEVARELAGAERMRVSLGTATALEVVEAQQAERESALASLRARADYANAEARLAHLVGALSDRYARDARGGGGS